MSRTMSAVFCWAGSLLLIHGCARPLGSHWSDWNPDRVCGDGWLEPGEECDGLGLGGATCWSLGFDDGALSCRSDCTLDDSGCFFYGVCGDGVLDYGEHCDSYNLGGESCNSLGYTGGALSCTQWCSFELSGCGPPGYCGNGVIEGDEQCDDGNQGSCDGCDSDCRVEVCGNGVIDCLEECDGADLGGQSCQGFGFPSGSLACTSDCRVDLSACGSGMLPELFEDFEDPTLALSRWTLTGDWEIGVPSASQEPHAYDGASCLGTRMAAQYSNNQAYLSNMAISPTVDLGQSAHPILRFQRWISIETCCDALNVWIRPLSSSYWMLLTGSSTSYTATVNGQSGWSGSGPELSTWTSVTFDLAGFGSQGVQVAFAMATDPNVAFYGAYIDAVYLGNLADAPY